MSEGQRIAFRIEDFKRWLERIGCDCCQYSPTLEGNKIVHNWVSDIQYVKTKHKDIELEGEIIV